MPNGWSRPEANTSLLLGLAAPSAARRTRIRPGSDSAMKMSPFGATRTTRGSRSLETNSSTSKPGGTFGVAEIGFANTWGKFDADRGAYGGGGAGGFGRNKGGTRGPKPKARPPDKKRPRANKRGGERETQDTTKNSTQVASAAVTAAAIIPRGMPDDWHSKSPRRMAVMNRVAVSM